MKHKRAMVVISIIAILLICIAFTTKTFQNDTYYTIKVGESILKHGIDMKDHFSIHQLSYTYPHWLYDIGIYKLYQFGGFRALYYSTIIIFMMIGVSFYSICLKRNKSYFMSLLFSILMLIMMARFAVTRAQLVTYLLFLFEIFFIEQLLSTGKKRYMIFLFILCLLIANVHAAVWPLYFILMLPYLFEALVFHILNKFNNRPKLGIFEKRLVVKKSKYMRLLVIAFVFSLFIGFVTPIGDTPYTYFIKIMMGDTTSYIEEHKPLILIENAFVIGYLVILFGSLVFTKVKIRLSDFAMIGGLLLMTFISTRHFAILSVVGMFYLCRLICNIGKINGKRSLDFDLPFYELFIVFVTIVACGGFVYHINYQEEFIDYGLYPVTMVDWMKKNLDMDKVVLYNDYDFGSYLIYEDIPVFIDSRSDLYTKPFNGKSDIFDECMKITEHYGRIFNKYHITHILIYKSTDLNQILTASPNYKMIKSNSAFSLFEYLGDESKNNENTE